MDENKIIRVREEIIALLKKEKFSFEEAELLRLSLRGFLAASAKITDETINKPTIRIQLEGDKLIAALNRTADEIKALSKLICQNA